MNPVLLPLITAAIVLAILLSVVLALLDEVILTAGWGRPIVRCSLVLLLIIGPVAVVVLTLMEVTNWPWMPPAI